MFSHRGALKPPLITFLGWKKKNPWDTFCFTINCACACIFIYEMEIEMICSSVHSEGKPPSRVQVGQRCSLRERRALHWYDR